jgi:hypothetical protein
MAVRRGGANRRSDFGELSRAEKLADEAAGRSLYFSCFVEGAQNSPTLFCAPSADEVRKILGVWVCAIAFLDSPSIHLTFDKLRAGGRRAPVAQLWNFQASPVSSR